MFLDEETKEYYKNCIKFFIRGNPNLIKTYLNIEKLLQGKY